MPDFKVTHSIHEGLADQLTHVLRFCADINLNIFTNVMDCGALEFDFGSNTGWLKCGLRLVLLGCPETWMVNRACQDVWPSAHEALKGGSDGHETQAVMLCCLSMFMI